LQQTQAREEVRAMQNQKLMLGIVVAGAVFLLTLAFGTTAVHGQASTGVIRVDGLSGSDSPTCGSEAAPCKSLQSALNNVAEFSGATVLVAEGTYMYAAGVFNACEAYLGNGTSVLCVFNKQIVLMGGYPHGNWTQADPDNHPTIIDGQGQRRGIYVFTDPNKYAGSLRLVDVIVQNGFAQGATSGSIGHMTGFGGGLLADYARVELLRVTFRNNQARGGNTAQDAGGSAAGGGMALRTLGAGTSLEHVVFTNNQVFGGSGMQRGGYAIGGGLFTYQTAVSGHYITATNNQATGGSTTGVGLYNGETGDAQGAGIAFQISTDADLQAVSVMSNTTTGGNAPSGTGGGAFGGGIFAEEAAVHLHDIVIRNNIGRGGAALNPASTKFRGSLAEGGGLMTDRSSVVLEGAVIIVNQALAGNGSASGYGGAAGGGGAYFNANLNAVKTVTITNSIIADNYAAMGTGSSSPDMQAGGGGGGVTFHYVQPIVQFTTIARNRLNSTAMQGVAVNGAPQDGKFDNTIIADHTVPAGMHAVAIQTDGDLLMQKTLWAGNSFNIYTSGGPVTNWSPINVPSAEFVSPGAPNYNYHIKPTSPAKDAAAGSAVNNDVDEQWRPWLSAADVGADECVPLIAGGGPVASGQVLLNWWADTTLLTGVAHYDLSFTCPPGAVCPGTINAGTNQQHLISGLTNGKTYTVVVAAKDSSNQTLSVSNSIQFIPADHFIYLPLALR
jgi:hypothetical protein